MMGSRNRFSRITLIKEAQTMRLFPSKSSLNFSRLIFAVIPAMILALNFNSKDLMAEPGDYRAVDPSAQDVACLGQVVPGEKVLRLAAPAGSIIGDLRVRRGDRLEPGVVAAVLRDAPLYEARVALAQREVALAEAELELVRAGERQELLDAQQALIDTHLADAGFQKKYLERITQLLKENHIAQNHYDEAASRLQALEARISREKSMLATYRTARKEEVFRAELAVKVAQAKTKQEEAQRDLQFIRAPFAGEVLAIHAWPGEMVQEDGAVVSLGDTDNMRILADVYESDIARVKVGQQAEITGRAIKGQQRGEVVEIQRFIEPSQVFPLDPAAYVDRRVVQVHILPDDPEVFARCSLAQVVVRIQVP